MAHVRDCVDITFLMSLIFNHLFVQTILGASAREFFTLVKRKGLSIMQ